MQLSSSTWLATSCDPAGTSIEREIRVGTTRSCGRQTAGSGRSGERSYDSRRSGERSYDSRRSGERSYDSRRSGDVATTVISRPMLSQGFLLQVINQRARHAEDQKEATHVSDGGQKWAGGNGWIAAETA